MPATNSLQRYVVSLSIALCLTFVSGTGLDAQGVTTGAITGTVTDPEGNPVSGAQVQVTNRATGYNTGTLTRTNGIYFVQGLEVGGAYTVLIRNIGFADVTRENVRVSLSQATRVDAQLATEAVQIAALEVNASRAMDFSPTRQGVSTIVTDSLISRLPSNSRDFADLVKLSPQVVRPQDGNGPSAGGQYNRFNSYTIDGANAGERFNLNGSGGTPGGNMGSKIVSMDAVKEFRVSMTPSDVRLGNFTGMLVNAVTKNGTNEFKGGGTFAFRNQELAAEGLRTSDFAVKQYAFNVGGPIIRDRLHFFIAPDFQVRERPATGQFVGQPADFASRMNISPDSLTAIASIMQQAGLDIGTTGQVTLDNPVRSIFGRLDFALSDKHRAVLRHINNRAADASFSRTSTTFNSSPNVQNSGFRFGSNLNTAIDVNTSTVLQLYSNMSNGWANEFIAGYNTIEDSRDIPVRSPEISVAVVGLGATSTVPTAAATFGTEQFSPNNLLRQKIFEVVNNLSIPFGRHTMTVGGRFSYDYVYNFFAQRSFGVYTFASIADLRANRPTGYTIGYDNSGTGNGIPAELSTRMYSAYLQDQWLLSDRLSLTYGLRADLPTFPDAPLANPALLTASTGLFNTAIKPKSRVLLSPRVGFNFDPSGDQQNQIRGSVGVFTGPPPYILIANAYGNTGMGLVTLTCTGAQTPAFTLDVNNLPRSCAGTAPPAPGAAGTAGVNLNDPEFKFPQSFTASAGFDRQLPAGFVFTLEGVYRHAINGVLVRDANLRGPRLVGGTPYTDRNGRVLYADTISATGAVTFNNARYMTTLNGVAFGEGAIQLTNQSEDYNYTISGQLYRRFSSSLEGTFAYTFMQSKDVQSLTSDRAISNWRNGRQLATSHDDLTPKTSYFERPHRFLAFGTYTAPWKTTDISFYYQGISGTPFTYTASGDLNGDGFNGNDPLYIPLNATDPNEVRIGTLASGVFTPNTTQAQAFEDFIGKHDCLQEQRGKIMERDSCRSPMQHTLDVALMQSLRTFRGQRVTLRLDVINVLNLLNKEWGAYELPVLSNNFPQQALLTQTARTPGPLNQSQPVFTYSAAVLGNNNEPFQKSSGTGAFYQMQLSLKYTF
jgi:hypothetical protein